MIFKNKLRTFSNGGGGDKAPAPQAAPAAAAPAPTEDTSTANDAAKQAEIERQRSLRSSAGQVGPSEVTGTTGEDTTTGTDGKTLLGS